MPRGLTTASSGPVGVTDAKPYHGDQQTDLLIKIAHSVLGSGGSTAVASTEAKQDAVIALLNTLVNQGTQQAVDSAAVVQGITDLNTKVATAITEVTAAKDAITTGSTQNHTDLLALLTQLQTQFTAVDGIENLLTANGGELLLIRQNVVNTLGLITQFRTDNATGLATLNTSTQQVLNAIPVQTTALVTAIQGLFDVEIDIGTSTIVAPATEARLIERSVAINQTTQVRSAPVFREVNTGALITDGTVFDTSLTESQKIQYTETVENYVDTRGVLVARKRLVYKINSDGTPSNLVGETITDANGAVITALPSGAIVDTDVSTASNTTSPHRIVYAAYKYVVTKNAGSNSLDGRLNPDTFNFAVGGEFSPMAPLAIASINTLISIKYTVVENSIPNFVPTINIGGYYSFEKVGQSKTFSRPRLDIPLAGVPSTGHYRINAGTNQLSSPQTSESGRYEVIVEISFLG